MQKVQGLVLGAVLTFGGCDRAPTVPGAGEAATEVLYIESNDPTPGQNGILAYRRGGDGSLTSVPGSPFASGGVRPVSVGLAGDRLYVANQVADGAQSGATLPNYTGFTVGSGGQLTPIAGSTVTVVAQASPSQALVSPGRDIVFGADFLAPMAPTPQPSLARFGSLRKAR